MTVSGTRGAARKPARKNIRFGHKLVHVFSGPKKTLFAIHEDLLCSSSKYFKRKLQNSRKPVEGECSVCTEDIDEFAKVSYCNGCGQNFHTTCIDDWLQRERTCPLCRLEWPLQLQSIEEIIVDTSSKNWPSVHFNRYMQWLYTGTVPQDVNTVKDCINGLALGEYLEDHRYMTDHGRSLAEVLSSTGATITCEQISWFYEHSENPRGRKFLVDLCAACSSLVDLTVALPPQFLLDLTHKLLSKRPAGNVRTRQDLIDYLKDHEEDYNEGAED